MCKDCIEKFNNTDKAVHEFYMEHASLLDEAIQKVKDSGKKVVSTMIRDGLSDDELAKVRTEIEDTNALAIISMVLGYKVGTIENEGNLIETALDGFTSGISYGNMQIGAAEEAAKTGH